MGGAGAGSEPRTHLFEALAIRVAGMPSPFLRRQGRAAQSALMWPSSNSRRTSLASTFPKPRSEARSRACCLSHVHCISEGGHGERLAQAAAIGITSCAF